MYISHCIWSWDHNSLCMRYLLSYLLSKNSSRVRSIAWQSIPSWLYSCWSSLAEATGSTDGSVFNGFPGKSTFPVYQSPFLPPDPALLYIHTCIHLCTIDSNALMWTIMSSSSFFTNSPSPPCEDLSPLYSLTWKDLDHAIAGGVCRLEILLLYSNKSLLCGDARRSFTLHM